MRRFCTFNSPEKGRFHFLMKVVLLSTLSLSLISSGLILNCFITHSGLLFPALIMLTASSANVLILFLNLLAILLMLSQTLISFFFTQLRPLEVEHVYERIWFSVMDTCLALTIFRVQPLNNYRTTLTLLSSLI